MTEVNLNTWAMRWGVSPAALLELRAMLLPIDGGPPRPTAGTSEAAVQSQARVTASRLGWRVWRNNVGVHHDPDTGAYVRFGLANDSHAVNRVCKSGDLIGIRPIVVTPAHVGTTIGQFASLECKPAGWKFRGDPHEQAQMNWAQLVTSLGGYARFVNDGANLC